MSVFAELYAEIQNDSVSELQDRIAYAKHMKDRFQTMIEACHKAMELRRIEGPAANEAPGEMDEVVFTGVLEGRPMFEFQAMTPPAWMVSAIKAGHIWVNEVDGNAYVGARQLASGDVVAPSEIL